jgi:hypothetical protein
MEQNNMTAVEWLHIQLKKGIDYNPLDPLSYPKSVENLFDEAKQMEKEQLINAHKEGNKHNGWALQHEHEKYYNKLYGKKTEG